MIGPPGEGGAAVADVGDLRFGRSGGKQQGVEGGAGRDFSAKLCQDNAGARTGFSNSTLLSTLTAVNLTVQ